MINEILIIDDDKSCRFLLKERISSLGYKYLVHETCNGKEVLEFLIQYEESLKRSSMEKQIYMLIFLDINMPVMIGFDFMEEFKNISREFKKISLVVAFMISSSENPKDLERIDSIEEIEDFVLKYPDVDVLRNTMKNEHKNCI